MQYFYLEVNITGKEKVISGPSWNRRCWHWFSVKILLQGTCKGLCQAQASLLHGAQSSHDISSSHYPHALLFLLLSAPSSQGHYVRSVYLVWLNWWLGEKKFSNSRSANPLTERSHFTKYKFINVVFYHCDPNACSLKWDLMLPHLSWGLKRKLTQQYFQKISHVHSRVF